MRRIDIALAIGFVILVLGLIFLPDLISKWRADDDAAVVNTEPVTTETPVELPVEDKGEREPLDPEEELERVRGMLMLHQACADRIEGFAERSQPVMESWRELNAATLEKPEARPDFHIVFGEAEGLEPEVTQDVKGAERELCEGNLESMRAEVERARSQ